MVENLDNELSEIEEIAARQRRQEFEELDATWDGLIGRELRRSGTLRPDPPPKQLDVDFNDYSPEGRARRLRAMGIEPRR